MKYIIVNSNHAVVAAIQNAVDAVAPIKSLVSVVHADLGQFLRSYLGEGSTAIVSPANSLGYMGGGFDKAILSELTGDQFPNFNYKLLERAIQANAAPHRGYIVPSTVHVVNLAEVYRTAGMDFRSTLAATKNITTLLQVPTMVVPEATTPQVIFDSMWNVLVEAERVQSRGECECKGENKGENKGNKKGNKKGNNKGDNKGDNGLHTVILPALGGGYGGVEPAVVGHIMAGAIGLFTMDVPPLARSLAVLLFTRKDHRKLGLPHDVGELESYMHRDKVVAGEVWPMPWDQLMAVMR